MNSLATSVCESMLIAIYTTQKIQLNMRETEAGSGSIKHENTLWCNFILV